MSARAGERLLARFDEVIATMRERILEEEPAYRRLPPAELADVTELLASNARLLVAAMGGHRVNREQLDYVAEHVRHRVRSGISLEAVLQAYRTALNAFWEECTAEVAGLGLSRDAAVELARRVSEAMDTLTTHAAATYVREESRLRALDDQAARDLLDALLRGDVDPTGGEPHSAAPGLDPQGDLVVVVARVSTTSTSSSVAALDRAAGILADRLATRRASPLLVIRAGAVVAVAPAEALDRHVERLTSACAALAAETSAELFCGLSSPCAGFGRVAAAFEQASLAVSRASERRPGGLARRPACAAAPAERGDGDDARAAAREGQGDHRAAARHPGGGARHAARLRRRRHERHARRRGAPRPREHGPLPPTPHPRGHRPRPAHLRRPGRADLPPGDRRRRARLLALVECLSPGAA
jgi:hypothetical protein